MGRPKILVVQRRGPLRRVLRTALASPNSRYAVRCASPRSDVLARMARERPMVLILGCTASTVAATADLCERIRAHYSREVLGLIVVAARIATGVEDIQLELHGANHCFRVESLDASLLRDAVGRLVARVRGEDQGRLRRGPIELDRRGCWIRLYDRKVALTEAELDVVWQLAVEPGRVRSQLALLGGSFSAAEARQIVGDHVYNVRRKLGPDADLIGTRWRRGYFLDLGWERT